MPRTRTGSPYSYRSGYHSPNKRGRIVPQTDVVACDRCGKDVPLSNQNDYWCEDCKTRTEPLAVMIERGGSAERVDGG